jgi:hypothetical protein
MALCLTAAFVTTALQVHAQLPVPLPGTKTPDATDTGQKTSPQSGNPSGQDDKSASKPASTGEEAAGAKLTRPSRRRICRRTVP